jgi:hypothetical protein
MAEAGAPKGNKNYLKGAVFNDALRRAIAQDDGQRIRDAAEKLLDLAAEGTPWAVRELADRTDGKSAQSVLLIGDPENPLELNHKHGMDTAAIELINKIRGT